MHEPLKFPSIPALKRALKEAGNSFFGPFEMGLFNSKLESSIIYERYIITSEFPDDPADKRYSARYFYRTEAGNLMHYDVGGFMAHETVADARRAIAEDLVKREDRDKLLRLLASVGLRYGNYDSTGDGMAFRREDGEYLLAEVADDGSAVELIEGNRVTRIPVTDFADRDRFAWYVRQQVDAKIADWLAED